MLKTLFSEYKRLSVLLVLSILLNVLIFVLYTFPLHKRGNFLAGQSRAMDERIQEKEALLEEESRWLHIVTQNKQVLQEVQNAIPQKIGGLAEFVALLYQWDSALALHVENFSFDYEKINDQILKVDVSFNVRTTYANFKTLLGNIERNDQLMTLSTLSITDAKEGGLTMRLGLESYYYEKEPVLQNET